MTRVLMTTAVMLAVSSAALAAEKQKVSLHVTGAVWGGCAKALSAALVQGGATLDGKVKPNKKGPAAIICEIASDADLAKLAAAVNGCKTPHAKKVAPGVALVLFAKLTDDSAAAATKALGKVNGVDGSGSSADTKAGTISAKLSGSGKVTVADVQKALDGAGVKAGTAK